MRVPYYISCLFCSCNPLSLMLCFPPTIFSWYTSLILLSAKKGLCDKLSLRFREWFVWLQRLYCSCSYVGCLQGSRSSRTSWPSKLKALWCFKTSRTTNPAAQCHIPEDLSHMKHHCKNLKSHMINIFSQFLDGDRLISDIDKMIVDRRKLKLWEASCPFWLCLPKISHWLPRYL